MTFVWKTVRTVISCKLLHGKINSQLYSRYSHIAFYVFNLWSDQFLIAIMVAVLSTHSTHSLHPVLCHCVTFSMSVSCPDTTVWVGGREFVRDQGAHANSWVWDHSGEAIDSTFWQPGGSTDADYVDLSKQRLHNEFNNVLQHFLCETDASNLVCWKQSPTATIILTRTRLKPMWGIEN